MSTEGAGIKRSEKGTSVFDRMISALMNEQGEYGYLDDCMSWEIEAVNKVPLRYRIIALGFAKHLSLDELNEKLKSQGCAGLYSRSLWEASLIYAFKNGLSYEEWKDLQEICFEIRNEKVTPRGNPALVKPMKIGMDEQEQNGVTVPSSAPTTLAPIPWKRPRMRLLRSGGKKL